ncbi:MAG: DUF3267 domain-containing protein [Balneolaceae bacterium]|nr:DUF3267 domain-containing protein [Balneolaceae bacterium]
MSDDRYAISLIRANVISLVLFVPLSVLLLLPHGLLWGWAKTWRDLTLFYERQVLFLSLMAAGIIAHEWLHGITWKWLGGNSWKSITFGVNWSALAPYAHCKEPLAISVYRWGAAAPGLILGVLPYLAGMVTGYGWFTLFGYLLTITASGDFIILWLIRKLPGDALVRDHPGKAGCSLVVDSRGQEVSRG